MQERVSLFLNLLNSEAWCSHSALKINQAKVGLLAIILQKRADLHSVTEVEVIVRVVVVFALAENGANEVEADGEPSDAEPNAETVVDNNTVEEESLESTVQEVEEPLLGGVGAMVPDVATSVS
jgi:hypothetical protein